MVKATRENLLKELKEKSDILELRIKTIEKQENLLTEKLEKLKKEIEEKFQAKKK